MHSFEAAHVFVHEPIAVPHTRRTYYEGSNAATGIGPVSLVPESKAWMKTFKAKKALYGKANRIAPGGRTPGVDSEASAKLSRKDDDLEPVFHFSLPWHLFVDVLQGLNPRTVTALTCGDGAVAVATIVMQKPFLGFA